MQTVVQSQLTVIAYSAHEVNAGAGELRVVTAAGRCMLTFPPALWAGLPSAILAAQPLRSAREDLRHDNASACERACRLLRGTPRLTIGEAAKHWSLKYDVLAKYLARRHGGLRGLRGNRPSHDRSPFAKPNGRLL